MNYAAKRGRPDGTCTHIARLRNGSPVLVRGQGDSKLVGETGFAPAQACAHEFLRLACKLVPPLAEKLVRLGRLARPRAQSAAVFKTARSTVVRHVAHRAPAMTHPSLRSGLRHLRASRSVHTQPHGRGGRICTGTGVEAQRILRPPCILIPTTPR